MFAPVFTGLCNRNLSKDVAALSAAEVVSIALPSTISEGIYDQSVRDDHRQGDHASDDD
jgi:hypothetical protein